MNNKRILLTVFVIAMVCCVAAVTIACQPTDFTINFVVDGSNYTTLSTSGQEVIRMPQNPAKDGYTFDGWYWDEGTWQRPFTENSYSEIKDNVNVFAKFSIITSTVTFDSNGGSSVEPIQNVTYNSLIEKPSRPMLTDKVFMGWYSDDKFNNEWHFDTDKVTQDVTLYAKWSTPTNLLYELNTDGQSYSVVGMNDNTTEVIIPHVYDNKPVTAIWGNGAGGAFFFKEMTNVYIPDSIASIGSTAFAQCFYLLSVNIPDSVTEIGDGAFCACWSLEEITVGKANSKYHSVDNCIIETETKTLIAGCKTSIIPDDGSVTKIDFAFAYSNISTINIPDNVTEIGNGAFFASGLTCVTLPSSITTIADNAFDGCNYLVEVCNKSQLQVVKGADTFGKVAKNAKNVYTPTSGKSNIVDDNGLIFYCDDDCAELLGYDGADTAIVLPQDINGREYTISFTAFAVNTNLLTITIPDFNTNLDCYRLPDVWRTNNNRNIIARETNPLYSSQDGVLYNKDKTEIINVYSRLERLDIPQTITVISSQAFCGCGNLSLINFAGTVEEWSAITKSDNWNRGVLATKVICSNGEVEI